MVGDPAGAADPGPGFLPAGSCFVVPQTDVAYVTRFGKVLEPQQGALLPGLHLKLPFVVQADLISITTDTFELPQKKAFTKDTQQLTLFAPQASRRPH